MLAIIGLEFEAGDEADFVGSLEGRLSMPGIAVVLGRNSSGKSALLEAVDQNLRRSVAGTYWPDYTGRFQATKEVSLELEIGDQATTGTGLWLLAQARDLGVGEPAWYSETVSLDEVIERLTASKNEPSGEQPRVLLSLGPSLRVEVLYSDPDDDIGWQGIDVDKKSPFRRHIPEPILLHADVPDLDAMATAFTAERFPRGYRDHQTYDRRGRPGPYWDRQAYASMSNASGIEELESGILDEALGDLSEQTTALLPSFLPGTILLRRADARQLIDGAPPVVCIFRDGARETHPKRLGSGVARWLGLCMQLAQRRLIARPDPDPDAAGRPIEQSTRLLLLDEPELHLHPSAMTSVAQWIVDRSRDSNIAGVIAATHSEELLHMPTELVSYAILASKDSGTGIVDVSGDMLAGLRDYMTDSGFTVQSWHRALRAVLLVEGEHDRLVIDHFFGEELRLGRILVLPLQGHTRAKGVVQSEVFGYLGTPMFVLLDYVNQAVVNDAQSPKDISDENRTAFDLLQLRGRGHDVTVLPYSEPDILCALPLDALPARFPHAVSFVQSVEADGYWDRAIKRWEEEVQTTGTRTSFKDWVAGQMSLKDGRQLVPELMGALEQAAQPSPALAGAIKTLFAASASGPEGLA